MGAAADTSARRRSATATAGSSFGSPKQAGDADDKDTDHGRLAQPCAPEPAAGSASRPERSNHTAAAKPSCPRFLARTGEIPGLGGGHALLSCRTPAERHFMSRASRLADPGPDPGIDTEVTGADGGQRLRAAPSRAMVAVAGRRREPSLRLCLDPAAQRASRIARLAFPPSSRRVPHHRDLSGRQALRASGAASHRHAHGQHGGATAPRQADAATTQVFR